MKQHRCGVYFTSTWRDNLFDYAGNQVNAECFNKETIKQDFEKELLEQIKKCIIPIHEYSSVVIATISPNQLSRLYHFYRSFYQAKAMSAFAKGLFQTAKHKEKASSLKIIKASKKLN